MAVETLAAGDLRHVVTLQEFVVSSTDGRGQPVGAWTDRLTMRANINPIGPRDAELVSQLYHEASHVVMMHYHSAVTREKRLRFNGRTLAIGYVGNLSEENRVLRVLCSEVV